MLLCLQGLVSLHKSAGRSADGAAKLLQALQWHMQHGIMQVGKQAGAASHCYQSLLHAWHTLHRSYHLCRHDRLACSTCFYSRGNRTAALAGRPLDSWYLCLNHHVCTP